MRPGAGKYIFKKQISHVCFVKWTMSGFRNESGAAYNFNPISLFLMMVLADH